MNKRDKRFIAIWANKIEHGVLQHYIKTILLTCIISTGVVLYYTWNNIPENNLIESILPISVLVFGLGAPTGLVLSWLTWTQGNNRYKFLTTDTQLHAIGEKKKWYARDRVWDLAVPNIGAIYFLLLYTSIFLFDSGNPSLLKYSIVMVTLSYFITQISYGVYRYRIDKLGKTKKFPLFFKYSFATIMFLTVLLWLVFFYTE